MILVLSAQNFSQPSRFAGLMDDEGEGSKEAESEQDNRARDTRADDVSNES